MNQGLLPSSGLSHEKISDFEFTLPSGSRITWKFKLVFISKSFHFNENNLVAFLLDRHKKL